MNEKGEEMKQERVMTGKQKERQGAGENELE